MCARSVTQQQWPPNLAQSVILAVPAVAVFWGQTVKGQGTPGHKVSNSVSVYSALISRGSAMPACLLHGKVNTELSSRHAFKPS